MKNSKGFTLIELLIVIGVLGILAAGLLAAVDPFEQLKKGRDTNVRNIVVELHNSIIRYYAAHGEFPWCAGADPCVLGSSVALEDLNAAGAPTNSAIDNVVADGELKGVDGADFISNVGGGNAAKIYVTSASGTQLTICFAPESRSLYLDGGTKFTDNAGTVGATCALPVDGGTKTSSTPGVGSCYWCAK